MRGDHLLETLEYAVTKSYEEESFVGANMLQFSGNNQIILFKKKRLY